MAQQIEKLFICPVCRGKKLDSVYPEYHGTGVSSDHDAVPDIRIRNALCRECGLIFNAEGIRHNSKAFYRESYKLMCQERGSQIQDFSGKAVQTQASASVRELLDAADLADTGRYLEMGAGKGAATAAFAEALPDWSIDAFEPGQSFEHLATAVPDGMFVRCDYAGFSPRPKGYDCIVAYGVLEHVADPLDMLQWAKRALADEGYIFIRVPNFACNPNDLFTVDHLSKLTVGTLHNLADRAGLSVQSTTMRGVSLFMLMRKSDTGRTPTNAYEANGKIVEANSRFARGAMNAIASARSSAQEASGRFAIFGLAASGLFSPYYLDFSSKEITAYVDENQSMHGSRLHDRPVVGLDAIKSLAITDIALVISPVYQKQVAAKLKPFGVRIHTPAQVED